jgi:hypothetical protein
MSAPQLIEDLLQPGLRIVFCGTALGRTSYERKAYYAQAALAPLWDARASNHFHWIARKPEAPFPKRSLDGVTQRVEFAHHRGRGDVFETFITISRDICTGELGERAMHNGPAQHRVDA